MTTIQDWLTSDDAVHIESSINGHDRGDGWNARVYQSRATRRYVIRTERIDRRKEHWYVSNTQSGADEAIAHGYTPGSGPGSYRPISNPDRLNEVRMLIDSQSC